MPDTALWLIGRECVQTWVLPHRLRAPSANAGLLTHVRVPLDDGIGTQWPEVLTQNWPEKISRLSTQLPRQARWRVVVEPTLSPFFTIDAGPQPLNEQAWQALARHRAQHIVGDAIAALEVRTRATPSAQRFASAMPSALLTALSQAARHSGARLNVLPMLAAASLYARSAQKPRVGTWCLAGGAEAIQAMVHTDCGWTVLAPWSRNDSVHLDTVLDEEAAQLRGARRPVTGVLVQFAPEHLAPESTPVPQLMSERLSQKLQVVHAVVPSGQVIRGQRRHHLAQRA